MCLKISKSIYMYLQGTGCRDEGGGDVRAEEKGREGYMVRMAQCSLPDRSAKEKGEGARRGSYGDLEGAAQKGT